jgi:tetratricopeptide (TPR) repeat protein
MDHPNIARIYDGGVTPNGQPFFVMELVKGVPLTRFCDRERLSAPERLELFVSVCQAVQHAHQKGIIHRDLKPANVLVTKVDGRPAPKVIDFGVAKATEQKLTDLSFSDVGAIVGTPAYMSPEQAGPSAMDIDTRTDIYALGVILYELLTGSPPFDASQNKPGAILELLRLVREVEPLRPSARLITAVTLEAIAANRRVEPAKLVRLLRGDLDWVVMKALEKDRARRYETANGLARDIQRYLAEEPVEARPPSGGYRLRKFVRRNRGRVIAACLVFLALVGGMVGTSVGLYWANQARNAEVAQRLLAEDAAEKEGVERKRAEDVAVLLESLFHGLDPNTEAELGQSLKQQLVARLDRLTAELEASPGDPFVRARMQFSIGQTLLGLTEYAKAEQALRQAVALRRDHLGAEDHATAVAELALAVACQHQGRFEEALALVEHVRRHRPDGKTSHDFDHMAGMIYQAAGRLDTAIGLFEAARDRLQAKGQPDTAGGLLMLHTLGAAYREVGRNDDAIATLEDVRVRRSQLLGPDSPDTLMTTNSLAVAYTVRGRLADAIRLHEETRARLTKRFGPDHATVLISASNLAAVLGLAGRGKEETTLQEELRGRAVAKLGPDNPYTLRIMANLARAYLHTNRFEDALKTFKQVLGPMTAIYGADGAQVLAVQTAMAQCYQSQGRFSDAVKLLEPLIQRQASRVGPDHPETLKLRADLAWVYRNTDKAQQAIGMFQEVLAKQQQTPGPDHADTLNTMYGLGCSYFTARNAKEAVAVFERLLPRRIERLGPEHADTLQTQNSLGAALWADRQFDKSIPLLEDTLRKQEKTLGAESRAILDTAENLLFNYESARQPDKLYDHAKVWLPRLMKARGPGHGPTGKFVPPFLDACKEKNRPADGVPVQELVVEALVSTLGPDDEGSLQAMNELGRACWLAGMVDRSIPLFEDLVGRLRRTRGESDLTTLLCVGSLARNYLDGGRCKDAIPLLADALQRARGQSGRLPGSLAFLQRDLAEALAHDGQRAKALATVQELVADARGRFAKNSSQLAGILASAGSTLLQIDAFSDAEKLLRESLTIREKSQPDSWSTFNTKSLLGGALLGQQRIAEAEKLLLAGYEGMKVRQTSIPPRNLGRIAAALDRLVEFCRTTGKADEAAKWQAERAKFPLPKAHAQSQMR